ncbi:MAG: flagellar biosynthesis repressor FlbT [Caulobacteraceae bacterium]
MRFLIEDKGSLTFASECQADKPADTREHKAMALKLTLRPRERIVINGAVFENGGERNIALLLQNKVSVLLDKDIMQPQDANTPVKRVYFLIMLMYLDEDGRDRMHQELAAQLAEICRIERNPSIREEYAGISNDVADGACYRALMRCRNLISYEAGCVGAAR